jgi:hypothetical protein
MSSSVSPQYKAAGYVCVVMLNGDGQFEHVGYGVIFVFC